jgi:hypothetical protein
VENWRGQPKTQPFATVVTFALRPPRGATPHDCTAGSGGNDVRMVRENNMTDLLCTRIPHRNAKRESLVQFSADSARARVGPPELPTLSPRILSCSVQPTRLRLHAPSLSQANRRGRRRSLRSQLGSWSKASLCRHQAGRADDFVWPRREVKREQAKGETPVGINIAR